MPLLLLLLLVCTALLFIRCSSVKEHAIALARSFEAPVVVMHPRGHIVPPLAREHLAVLRAFLTAMRDLPALGQDNGSGRRRQQAGSSTLDPLEPPLPVWETEDEQVRQQLQSKQQLAEREAREQQQQQEDQQRQQQYVQVLKLSGPIPKSMLAAKL